MTDHSSSDLVKEVNRIRNVDSTNAETHRHPLGAGIGAVLAAGTAGATGGVLVGPVGAVVGAVVGALAGGLGGQAIAELIDPISVEDDRQDAYTRRIHVPSEPTEDEELADSASSSGTKQAPREAWNRLDQSNKDLLSETLSDEP